MNIYIHIDIRCEIGCINAIKNADTKQLACISSELHFLSCAQRASEQHVYFGHQNNLLP